MIVGELTWQQFQQLNNIRNLPLNEQVRRYNAYLEDLNTQYLNWLARQPKGPAREIEQAEPEEPFLLQEDGFYLLQENGDKIIL